MAHTTNDFFAAIDPVVNRSFYGLDPEKTEKQAFDLFQVGSDDEPQKSAVEFAGPATLSLKTENAAVALKNIQQGPIKTFNTSLFAGAVVFSIEAAKDVKNRYAKISQGSQALGEATRETPEALMALYLDRAFNSAFPATADGIELCGTHVLPDGVTTSANELATPSALDEASAEEVIIAGRGILGPSGNLRHLRVVRWVVPSAYANIASKLSTSDKTIGTANNADSVVKGTKFLVIDRMVSQTRWFAEMNAKENGLFWDWIEKTQFVTDQVPMNLQKAYIAYFRQRHGCVDWRHMFGSAAT